jgi:transmembrane sensor
LVVLDDGTRMSLNTDTRVSVDLDSVTRKVSGQRGEALFEVAKDPRRPFVVREAGSEVVALGTVFSVRLVANGGRGSDALAVTLIEGAVTVSAAGDGDTGGLAPAKPLLLQPGERVRLTRAAAGPSASAATLQVDRRRIDLAVAWKRSEAVFDDTSLADAVAGMNRYSRTPIVLVEAGALTERHVSGVYRTGDNAGFVRAVAALHGLVLHARQDHLELAPGS